MKINKLLIILFYALFIGIIFSFLFHPVTINGSDYISPTTEQLSIWKNSFLSWNADASLGWSTVPLLNYSPYSWLIGWLGTIFRYNTWLVERIVWWFPFLILGFSGSFLLSKRLHHSSLFSFLSPFLFLFNTYILMVIGGGQIAGIGMAYALSPFLFLSYISLFEKPKLEKSILLGIILALMIMFDLRITYIILIGLGSYLIIETLSPLGRDRKKRLKFFLLPIVFLGISGVIAFFLQAFWLLPQALVRQNPLVQLGAAYSSISAVQFFSFAKFENAIGLLHPNWPENIFGKTYFMRFEFLLLPILAYSAFLFIKKNQKENKHILFFGFIGILGAFLAKGANDPFGTVYLWCFQHFPGFIMFRDPTKWYLLVAISYSVLIPYSVGKIYLWIKGKKFLLKFPFFNVQNIFFLLIISLLLFLIRPVFLGQVTGVFRSHQVPEDYMFLNGFLNSQNSFSRTLWVPVKQRFGFYSPNHPIVLAQDLFHVSSLSGVIDILNKPGTETLLQHASIRYIIIPYDSEGEIFLKDRHYDSSSYVDTIAKVQKIIWLHEISGFGKIHVFELLNTKDHFWLPSLGNVSYSFYNPTQYIVNVSNVKKGDMLVFSESFYPNWSLILGKNHIQSKQFENLFNSFALPKDGAYTFTVYYEPQLWVNRGLWISGITIVLIMGGVCLILIRKRKMIK